MGRFTLIDIKDTLNKVVSGHLQTHHIDKVTFADRDCISLHASLASTQLAEDDDIMKETLEELRQKREADRKDTQDSSTKASKRGRQKRKSRDDEL